MSGTGLRTCCGVLTSIVDRVLEEAAEAHQLVETEERIGAIVLAISDRANERS